MGRSFTYASDGFMSAHFCWGVKTDGMRPDSMKTWSPLKILTQAKKEPKYQGRFRLDSRKMFFPRGCLGTERLSREWSQLQGCLSSRSVRTTVSGTGGIVGCPVQGQELDSMVLVGPFQLNLLFDSITHCYKRHWNKTLLLLCKSMTFLHLKL